MLWWYRASTTIILIKEPHPIDSMITHRTLTKSVFSLACVVCPGVFFSFSTGFEVFFLLAFLPDRWLDWLYDRVLLY